MTTVDRRTRTRAKKAVELINKMIAEQTKWQGKKPTRVRVRAGDFLALAECNYINDGKLSGTNVEVLIG